jgi:hypothetical protein
LQTSSSHCPYSAHRFQATSHISILIHYLQDHIILHHFERSPSAYFLIRNLPSVIFDPHAMSGTLTERSSSSSFKVLSAPTINILRARGEGSQQGGYRAVSNTSYATADSLDSEATVLIPDELESLETLQFLEFNHTTAVIIWERLKNLQIEFPEWANVLASAKSHVRGIAGHDITSENDDEWVDVMRKIGLTSNFQARMMTSQMRSMRLSGSLKDWIWQMFEMRYEFLLTLDNVLQAPSVHTLGRIASKPSLGGSFTTKSALALPARVSSQASQGPNSGSFQAPTPQIATVAEDPPKQIDGHVMLLKGLARSRLDGLFQPNGALNFHALLSRGTGDFDSLGGLYFTKTFDMAWRDAQWAQTIADKNVVPVEILHVAVPQHLFASSRELYGNEWRRFVWANRIITDQFPTDLRHLTEFPWLIGPVCHSPTAKIKRMNGPAELEIWKLAGNQTAGQFFTRSNKMMWQMDTACVGKVWRTAVQVEKKG